MDFVKEWDDVVIMGFFESENNDILNQYLEANNDIRDDYRFGHTFDLDARKSFGFTQNTIALIQPEKFMSKYEDKYAVFKVSFVDYVHPGRLYTKIRCMCYLC